MTELAQTLRQQLEARKNELLGRRAAIHRDLSHENRPLETDLEDQASERGNEEVLDGLDIAARDEIDRINSALQRITSGTYTTCQQCGADISPERLSAVPDTAICIDCAQE